MVAMIGRKITRGQGLYRVLVIAVRGARLAHLDQRFHARSASFRDELVLGLEMSIETAAGEASRLHQLIHTGGLDSVTAEFRGGRLDDATVRPGGFSPRLLHAMPS